jgi:ketosteroid isomerase-like protein
VSEGADTIRHVADALNAFMRGELSNEALAEGVDPQIELLWRDRQTYPDFPQHLRGRAEFIALFEQLRDGWIDLIYELLELIEVPDGRVVALVRHSGRGRQSGVPIVVHFFELCTIRDGRVRKLEFFRHRADALQAVGLGERATSANLDLVRSIHARWERGDYSSAPSWADPEMELVFADGPTPGSWTGIESATSAWRDFLAAWNEWEAEVEEYRELDSERVLALTRHRGRGKTSGLDLGHMRSEGASLYHVRGGKVVRNVFYLDRHHALADLGLRE